MITLYDNLLPDVHQTHNIIQTYHCVDNIYFDSSLIISTFILTIKFTKNKNLNTRVENKLCYRIIKYM